jgi:hypothetical protein
VIGLKADGRHPLFDLAGHVLTGVAYLQPGVFAEALSLSGRDRDPTIDVRCQIEVGVGYN